MKILLVDDEAEICLLLSTILRKEGFEVGYVHNLSEATRCLVSEQYAAVFLDLNLPDGSGFQMVEPIRKKNPKARIVIISAYDSERKQALSLGCDDFISKPFTRKHITDSLKKLNLSSV
ncbi:MAG: response regulator [Cyclobacteriaceae bacterium]|nr:response regulator [Cyclobacteriaceae bacterium]